MGSRVSVWSSRDKGASPSIIRLMKSPINMLVRKGDDKEVVFVPLGVHCELVTGPRARWVVDSRCIVNIQGACTAEVRAKGWALYVEYPRADPVIVAPERPVNSGRRIFCVALVQRATKGRRPRVLVS